MSPYSSYDANQRIDQTVAVPANAVWQGPAWHDDVGETRAPPGPLTAYRFPMRDPSRR